MSTPIQQNTTALGELLTLASSLPEAYDDTELRQRIETLEDALYFHAGDTWEATGSALITVVGYVTASSGTIYFNIPLPKKFGSDIVNVQCQQLTIAGRASNGGFIFDASSAINIVDSPLVNYSITKILANDSVRIVLTKASGATWATTPPNNSPCSITINNLSFTFS